MKTIQVHTDGAARGNPGPAAIAYVINDGQSLIEFSKTIGATTNNQAEYRALVAACQRLLETDPRESQITFFSDSELMVKQLRGEYRVKDSNIRPHYETIQSMLELLRRAGNDLSLTAVRRHNNRRADQLANQALDA